MDDCIFCKIVKGEIPCYKIWEDEDYLAFVDIFPILKDQILLISKKHIDSDLFNLDYEEYSKFLFKVKEVSTLLDSKLKPLKVGLMVEGLEVNHLHVKLFPLYEKEGFGIKHLNPLPSKQDFENLVNEFKK